MSGTIEATLVSAVQTGRLAAACLLVAFHENLSLACLSLIASCWHAAKYLGFGYIN